MENNQTLKLHLGCGAKKLTGWVNIDSVKELCPDLIHDLSQPLPYNDLTVEEVLAEDLLEHFDKYMRFLVFYDWTRILKINGIIRIQVPNFKKILHRYFKWRFDTLVDNIFGENMMRSEIYLGHFGNHKWGYSENSLKEFVKLFGIETINLEKRSFNLYLIGKKQWHLSKDELDKLRIYSPANDYGKGKADISIKEVKEKIKSFNTPRNNL